MQEFGDTTTPPMTISVRIPPAMLRMGRAKIVRHRNADEFVSQGDVVPGRMDE